MKSRIRKGTPSPSPRLKAKQAGVVSHRKLLRVGVTGGIGSGKSTVCKLFASLGRPVLSADEIARELTDTNEKITSSIRKSFGDAVFLPNGLVDRSALAAIVFNNHNLRKTLDAIIHPHVFTAIDRTLAKLDSTAGFAVIEAALIFETRMEKELDYVIVVTADEKTRVARVMARDRIPEEAVRARISSQMSAEQKILLADFVVENDGAEAELAGRVKFLDTLLAMMKPSAQRQ